VALLGHQGIINSWYSILDGLGSPKANVARAKKLGLQALGMTDHGSMYGHVDFVTQCKKAKIKPILGCELYIAHKPACIRDKSNRSNSHMVVWAKNKKGWLDLSKLVSKTNDAEYFYYKPRIHLRDFHRDDGGMYPGLESFTKSGNVQGFSGHQGSLLADSLFCDVLGPDVEAEQIKLRKAYGQFKKPTMEFLKQFLKPNWLESTSELALELESIFGKGNFFIELQNELNPNDRLALWIHPLIVECLREVSKQTGIPALASSDPHYPSPEDAVDQRLMVMVNLKENEASINEKLDAEEDTNLMVFFGSDSFYIHSYEEMAEKFTKEELENTVKVAEQVEVYDITHKPYVPNFVLPAFPKDLPYLKDCPTDYDKYFMYLVVEGAKKLKPWENPEWQNSYQPYADKKKYWDRINEEFKVIFKADLSKYFLVVWDYCMAGDYRPADHSFDWKGNLERNGKLDPIPRGVGRGSAAGCLVSYLCGITGVDPLLYGLIFSRFYNEGRNTGDHIELPDIDTDFAVEDRDWIIDYLRHVYGGDNVAQIITFQRMQGRAAVKDIFRVKGIENGFEIANEMCRHIPSEAEIADEIQEIRKGGDESYGILRWALDNSDEMKEYNKNEIYAELFKQATRCEGVKRATGRHPSGLIITPKPVEDCFPMALDTKSKQKIIGIDFNDVAKLGGVKYDLLGTAILDKLKMGQDLVNGVTPRRSRIKEYSEE
jgi:DNA polymerase III subunit alpha